jgi:hypothetical protein
MKILSKLKKYKLSKICFALTFLSPVLVLVYFLFDLNVIKNDRLLAFWWPFILLYISAIVFAISLTVSFIVLFIEKVFFQDHPKPSKIGTMKKHKSKTRAFFDFSKLIYLSIPLLLLSKFSAGSITVGSYKMVLVPHVFSAVLFLLSLVCVFGYLIKEYGRYKYYDILIIIFYFIFTFFAWFIF